MPEPKTAVAYTISKADMARRLGVSTACVSQETKPGKKLHPALIGNKINVRHPAALEWIAARDAAKPADPVPSAAESEAELGPWRTKVDLASLEEPLTQLTEAYGDCREFEKWVSARGKLATARRQEMLQARVAGKLIARTTVERMIAQIDVAFRLLLSDAPRSIATRIAPANMAGTAAIVRDAMQQILEAGRAQMMESLDTDDPTAPLQEASAAE
jgi:hypothetical protein